MTITTKEPKKPKKNKETYDLLTKTTSGALLSGGAAVKPPRFGLYTSTVSAAGVSMWSVLLGLDDAMMYPLPQYTWELEMDRDVTVAEIRSATDWVDFVCAHACISGGLVYPDWVSIAEQWDAIHVTLPMIVAAQGFHLSTPRGVIPPAFWDVETTIWLRWCFSGARLVESVTMPREGRYDRSIDAAISSDDLRLKSSTYASAPSSDRLLDCARAN